MGDPRAPPSLRVNIENARAPPILGITQFATVFDLKESCMSGYGWLVRWVVFFKTEIKSASYEYAPG